MSGTSSRHASQDPTVPTAASRPAASAVAGRAAGDATAPGDERMDGPGAETPTLEWPRRPWPVALRPSAGAPSIHEPLRLGHYYLRGLIGEGGMARIFRATDERTGRPVALKQLATGHSRESVARFVAEARALRRLDHPHVIRIHELVERGPGAPYYAMEILSGADLATILAREGRLPWRRALRIAAEVCEALAHVHAAGLVHRDLKPANVFVAEADDGSETVKLLDFGIVSSRRESGLREGFAGTPQYTAPEQVLGGATDERADIYALGVILYEMLTGTQPYRARTLAEAALHHMGAPPPLPSERLGERLPPAVDALVARCLARTPSGRPTDADAVGMELAALLQQRWSFARPRRDWRWARRAAVPAAIAAGLLALGTAGRMLPQLERYLRGTAEPATMAVEVPTVDPAAPAPAVPAP